MQKLRIFIGSSKEGLLFAKRLQNELKDIADAVVWDGLFSLGETTIESLFSELRRATHAVLIATSDDSARIRGMSFTTPRDNVIFELGLFMGRLGRRRTYLVADKALKLPSDLAGLTLATFETDAATLAAATDDVARKVREAIQRGTIDDEVQILESFNKIIGDENIELWMTYADMLRLRFHDITREVSTLRSSRSWERILETKILLREFLEFSGAYEDAARFGNYYFTALSELNHTFEAAWSKLKDIGYMNILAGRHTRGRNAINEVILSEEQWADGTSSDEIAELLSYAHRYLAISYHRDSAFGDIDKAVSHLSLAKNLAEKISPASRRYHALHARLSRNKAHLELHRGHEDTALGLYEQSLNEFTQMEDYEHIASTRMSIANALLMIRSSKSRDVLNHLRAADLAYKHLGAIEGSAKVNLLYARYFLRNCDDATQSDLPHLLSEADQACRKAGILFERISSIQFREEVVILQSEVRTRLHALNSGIR